MFDPDLLRAALLPENFAFNRTEYDSVQEQVTKRTNNYVDAVFLTV